MQGYYHAFNLFTFFFSVILAVFILSKGHKITNLLFSAYSLCVAGWVGAKFLSWIIGAPWNLFFMRTSIAFAIFLPVIYYHFSAEFIEKKSKRTILIYPPAFFLLFFSYSRWMVKGIADSNGLKAIVPGPLYVVFLLFFVGLITFGFLNYYNGLKKSEIIKKNQIKYLVLASIIGFSGGVLVFFSNLVPEIEPIGFVFIPFYSIIAAYAIVKHHLLDIDVVIRRGIIYSILTLLISGMYFMSFLSFRDYFNQFILIDSIWINFTLILLFAYFSQPLKNTIQDFVDRLFYKEKIDREKAIIAFSNQLQGIIEFRELNDFILGRVKEVLKIKQAEIFIINNEFNDLGVELLEKIKKSQDVVFISDWELLLPIYLKKELLGVLRVKEKLSDEVFSLFDVELLKTFLSHAAAALKNSFLLAELLEQKEELYRTSNLAALGTLSAGMAHEIKNPLAVIKGLTQILPENIEDPEFLTKFVSIVPGQIDRINSIIEALLKIGKRPGLKKEKLDLNALLQDIIGFVEISFKKKRIIIQKSFSKVKAVQGDYNMLYQAFFNLIQNSSQAMPEGGKITIKTITPRGVEISDDGKGIAEDKIDKIFSPFYTSREEGAGLGLFMVKKILEDHDAKIEVKSQAGKGCCFRIDFPKD